MLNCSEVTNLLSDELERPMSLRERMVLKLHLMMCSGCANYRRQMSAIRVAMHQYAEGRAITDEPDKHHGA